MERSEDKLRENNHRSWEGEMAQLSGCLTLRGKDVGYNSYSKQEAAERAGWVHQCLKLGPARKDKV